MRTRLLGRETLKALSGKRQDPCVSIFMPTHRKGREIRQDPIRLKNLVGEAEARLIDMGVRPASAREMLAPAASLLDDEFFWRHQGDGLALFVSSEFFRYYRLPLTFDELVVAANQFHIKPLLPLLTEDGRHFVLALSQNQVRLLECTRFNVREIDLEETPVPTSIEEALRYDDPEKQLQFRSSVPTPGRSDGGRWGVVFHGHGVVDEVKVDLERYFHLIDDGLRGVIGEGGAPLVLAGVDYLLPIYAGASRYDNLVDQGITGNPDQLSAEELQEQGWAVLEPHFLARREQGAARYREMLARGLASNDIREIVPAASYGRVDSLFVPVGVQVWGSVEEATGAVQIHLDPQPGDEDLLDVASVQTLFNSGIVFAVPPGQVPDQEAVAAVFRY